jgi:signal transduction histidine kinase
MPEIPVTGFVIEAFGASALALMLYFFERGGARRGIRDWSLGLWCLAAGLAASVAALHIRDHALRPVLLALAEVPYYWSRALLLLGTYVRWKDREMSGARRVLLVALPAVALVATLATPVSWRPVVRGGTFTFLMAPACLVTSVFLLGMRSHGRRLGSRMLALSFSGMALEDLFLFGAAVSTFVGRHPPLSREAADRLIEVELLLLLFLGVGMVSWLLADEREAAVRLEETVRRKEAMLSMGTLVAGVAHEVRNPLFAISANLDAIEACLAVQPAAVPFLEALRGEVERMGRLMSALLDYGRPVTAQLVAAPLGNVLDEAVRSCSALAARAEVVVETGRDVPAGLVAMDRPRLVQVFQNLIQNAIEHTPPRQRVLVELRDESRGGTSGLCCSVRDSGPGFNPGDAERVFEPFFTNRKGGTGLGLSIVRRIVHEHSGGVEAANHPEGGGVVTVWLPTVEGHSLATRERES